MENPSNIVPDQLIVLEGDAGLVPKASSGDVGKVLGVLNSSGDVGWVPDQEGMAQVQADWDQTDSSQVSYIANKPDLSVYATTSAMNTALADKQDTISDLSDIRSGAAKGDTAVQPAALEDYATTSAMNTALAGKQNTISDLDTIRAGAALGATAAQPSDLPSSDELLPSASSGDAGKILSVDSNGDPIWQTPAGGSDVVTANGSFKLGGSVPIKVNYTGSQEYERGSLQLVNTFASGTYAVAVFEVVGAHSIYYETYGDATVTISEAMDIAGTGNSDFAISFLQSDSYWNMDGQIYRDSFTRTDGKIVAQSLRFWSISQYSTGPYIGVGVKVTNNLYETEKVAAVVQQLANGAVSISDWPSEQILATTIPAKTSELTNDSNFVVSSSLATVATTGAYSDLTGTPTIPSVDQSYNAASTNAQSGTAVAQAIAAIPSSSYTAGDGIDITSNEISVDYDTNTLDFVGQTITENVTQQSSSGLFLLPSSVAALLSQQGDTQVTVHIPANTLKDENFQIFDVGEVTYRLTLYATDTPAESSVSLYSTQIEYTLDTDNAVFTEQDVVFNLPASVANQWSQNLSSAVSFSICGQRASLSPATVATLTVIGDLTTSPITFTFADDSVQKLAVKNPIPAVTSSDDGKVLKASYSGGQGSYAWGTDSDTTYTAGNMISIDANNSNAIGVTTTAGITDIQQVAALPANPVATVLYLIPEN